MLYLGLSLGLVFPFQLWSASILVFGFWVLLGKAGKTVDGATELSQRGAEGWPSCCRWLFCILIACRAEKYATKLTLACSSPNPFLPHTHFTQPGLYCCLCQPVICILQPAKGIRNLLLILFAFCPPEPATNASSITARTRSRLSFQFAQITQATPPPSFPHCIYYKMSAAPYGAAKIETFSAYVSYVRRVLCVCVSARRL